MNFKVVLLPGAKQNLQEIDEYLSQFYESTPAKFFKELYKKLSMLKDHPHIGSPYLPNPKYRKIGVGDYLVFYTVDEAQRIVEVHRVLHSRRDIEPHL